MLEFDFLQICDSYMKLYRQFPLPTVICDRELTVYWGNSAARATYPQMMEMDGVRALLEEYSASAIFEMMERSGSCTIPNVMLFSDMSACLLPIHNGSEAVGCVIQLVRMDSYVDTQNLYNASKSALAFSSGIRDHVDNIFSAMDSASAKADLFELGFVQGCFNKIGLDGYRILRIAENITEYAKLTGTAPPPPPRSMNLIDFLQSIRETLHELGRAAEIPVILSLPESPIFITVDRSLFELALYNILHNSLYFTKAGNQVHISAQMLEGDMQLIVQDRGVGIPADVLPTVWRPYVSYTNNGRGAGIGLGLATVRQVVTLYGGRAEIESTPGQGTRVALRLPCSSPSDPISLGQPERAGGAADRFSRIYVGLVGAKDSPYQN